MAVLPPPGGARGRPRAGLDPREDDGDVVLANLPRCGRKRLAGGVEVRVLAAEGGPQREYALVEGAGTSFHESVGIQREDRARPEPDAGLPVPGRGHPGVP